MSAEEIAPQAEELRIRFEKHGGMDQTTMTKMPIFEMDKCKCDGGGKFLELGGEFRICNLPPSHNVI